MQRIKIPFSAAKDIIGIAGETIDHIRRTSGSIITIEEDRSLPDEYILEVRGTTSQLQTAQQLIEVDFILILNSFVLWGSFVFSRPIYNIYQELVVFHGANRTAVTG